MPYICMVRTDIPDGFLQVLDLVPNTSQRRASGPAGQTKYIDRGEFTGAGQSADRPTTMADDGSATTYAIYGLAAYIADNINAATGATFFTSAQANTAATNIAAEVNAGNALTAGVVNPILAAIDAGSGLVGAGTSTGTLAGVLQICAGGSYLLPAESAVGGVAAAMGNGSFQTGTYRATYDTGALKSSFAEGVLSQYMTATWSYNPPDDPPTDTDVAGAAIVVYNDDGTVYTG